ncbi:inositolphosphorylceramide synthase [Pluteus cervinus]|uniref:Inositolphosphorylceramide synthase n=1 Tax=Pluteus cervinus TaxID=181527 RepID=A0ACD3A839_9AGAR|nr:inositolphosphorylceramide synthase [Pluteus cervinus]
MFAVSRTNHGGRGVFGTISQAFLAAVGRLDKQLSPMITLNKLKAHQFTLSDSVYIFHIGLATFWLVLMEVPGFPTKLIIPIAWIIALLVPLTSQFFVPATPIFSYLMSFYSSRFIPTPWRPAISVSLLPTLESVLYGANVSDILTRFTHPVLDIIAWIPYGVGHFTIPFIVAAFIWLFRPKEVLHLWGRAFGYMNILGVLFQIIFPCSAPWYELVYGLTPANYSMKGSPGGLARIDALFHSQGYTTAFSNSPVVFGAFPSLHAADATMEALFITHFFPQTTVYVWSYTGLLYWSTMYLTHHYLIDVVGGACLATAFFYLFLPDELKGSMATASPLGVPFKNRNGKNKYEVYDLEDPRGRTIGGANRSMMTDAADFELSEPSSDDEEVDITYRSTPTSAVPLINDSRGNGGADGSRNGRKVVSGDKKHHRHTASIASLIRGEERSAEDGWSPVSASFSR